MPERKHSFFRDPSLVLWLLYSANLTRMRQNDTQIKLLSSLTIFDIKWNIYCRPCWTVRLCDSTITDFCMNPQQKGESDSFPVYQFLRAAMAMSVNGRSLRWADTHVQLHVLVGGKRAAVANGVLVERSTAHLAETFKEGSGGGPACLLPSGHPSLSCLVSTLDFEMNGFDICIKEGPIMLTSIYVWFGETNTLTYLKVTVKVSKVNA